MVSSLRHDLLLFITMLIAWLPFLSFVLIMIFTRRHPKLSSSLSITTVSVSMLGAAVLLMAGGGMAFPIQYTAKWLVSGDIFIPFGFLLDPTSLLMLTLVAVISFLVQIYSLGYMAGDPGYSRYYAFQSLFAWAMMNLTLSSSMLQLYVFWELVGLSSYLLIGFWYEKFSASQAGKKAFVMTRLGDIAFFLGLLVVLLDFGDLNILQMNSTQVPARLSPSFMTLSALLIFGGIVGKSAQFPLLTWLPDAMEGPTPVSALLHSATMVAAGVYLFARLFPFLSYSPIAQTIFLAIGTISMLLAATMAMVDRDMKRVWAYSTISQLGFMIMGLAAGSYFAGVFHLTTHAGFKALLFLCVGVWIHQYKTNDMFEVGRQGGRRLKVPMACICLAAAALSGLPPFSGFFSKEAVMASLAAMDNPVWLIAGLAGAFLTSYYAFRLVFIILFPKSIEEVQHEKEARAQQSASHYWVMAWPLIILAGITLILGFFQSSLEDFLVGHSVSEGHLGDEQGWLLVATLGLGLCGVGLAWFEFGRNGSLQVGFVERISRLRALFAERWYLDHVYRLFVHGVIDGFFSRLSTRNDQQIIDGGIDGLSRFTLGSGRVLSFLQSGLLRYNLFLVFAVLAVVALYFLVV